VLDQQTVSLGRDFARALDICLLAKDCGINPDPVQAKLLTTSARKVLLCCTRQWGKSTIAALIALYECLYQAPAMVILVSPSQPQSTELFRKLHHFWSKLPGAPMARQESLTRMELANGSRIVSLPGSERTTRGFSACTLLIIDEAARVPEELLAAVRPTLAATGGRFFALSTPAGKRGWFYEAWNNEGAGWEKVMVKATECSRIKPEFLAEEMAQLGPMIYSQEYMCEFVDAETSVFSTELIQQAMVDDFEPFLPSSVIPV
jgi:Terminase large subunit, T4likevirus-type, N-terminal